MAEPVLLNFEKHGKLLLSECRDFSQFKSQHLVPIVFQEFYPLATEFPLVFVRTSSSGDFVPTALMGLS
ncbi:MAG: SapC family protein, partial [Gammaproteobacteria bacterium]|nr:SapC family protein [Gammaproteobacteria bacterium]